jgi:hypothetical protein
MNVKVGSHDGSDGGRKDGCLTESDLRFKASNTRKQELMKQ